MQPLKPFYEDVQAHYDLSNEFFQLFLDPTMTYSCAYFERPDMTLEQAQLAKIDLSLRKCDLHAGQRLLDVGCGWGATALRAAEQFGVRVMGLTLSRNQQREAIRRAKGRIGIEFRLQGWEEFHEPVDRIVSIGALEHFRVERYDAFFDFCRKALPPDGRMLIHSIVVGTDETLGAGEAWRDRDYLRYLRFIRDVIFPGGQVPRREQVITSAVSQGFKVTHTESLRLHYARTLDQWAANLLACAERAKALVGTTVFDQYVRYLTQSAEYFRKGHNDVMQFSMQVG
jgi:cyclopropane-fatty-acyl-phospholipid synthase